MNTFFKQPRAGFSLLETIIFGLILAIIISLFSLGFTTLYPKYKLKRAVWEIYSRLNYARYKAIFRTVKIKVKFDSTGYALQKYDSKRKEWVTNEWGFLDGVSIEATNSPIFHPMGTVSNLASIYLSNTQGRYKITLAITGRIKITQL